MPARANTREASEASLRNRVEAALAILRPAIQADGGDILLVDITDEGVVHLKMVGACGDCPLAPMTLKLSIEDHLLSTVPGVVRVDQI